MCQDCIRIEETIKEDREAQRKIEQKEEIERILEILEIEHGSIIHSLPMRDIIDTILLIVQKRL